MYMLRQKWLSKNGKAYKTAYLRQSVRVGRKVQSRIVANLSHCSEKELDAIEWALKHRHKLPRVKEALGPVTLKQGVSVGAVWAVTEVARRCGIEAALGQDFMGKLALWQVVARVLHQGSRLSAVRLAQLHAAGDALGLERGFDENDLYENLHWLAAHQPAIEDRLFERRGSAGKPQVFLYDVTSTYLEGDKNAFADWGYNRDKKKGKKQFVVGLLCDETGEPLSTEVFRGNTRDVATFAAQVRKAADRFGCERVTFVGDRGMIKSGQIKDLAAVGFHFITALTKPQIEALLKQGVLQMDLFDDAVCEVRDGERRYLLRRNPVRAAELAASRADKHQRIECVVESRNTYLREHPRAWVSTAERLVRDKIKTLRVEPWLDVRAEGRRLQLVVDEETLEEIARLDGCYVVTTDLTPEAADKERVHERYKDLAEVEQGFRTCKTGHLEMRPVYVRSPDSTRAHVLVVMLAYIVRRQLARAWAPFDLTVKEGLDQLKMLCAVELTAPGGVPCLRIPMPGDSSRRLLEALAVTLPEVLPHRDIRVVTRKRLPENRRTP
jgi:mRNA-degrading endonuclease toxin of MazEF toxin-antitoxin module